MGKKEKKKAKEKKTLAKQVDTIPDSMTVLVPGTFSDQFGFWFIPGRLNLHRYLRRYVFPDVYSGRDYFTWDAEASDEARCKAADDLIQWCETHPARQYNFVAHSHGCNVVSLASNRGLDRINKLVYLAPPVWLDKEGYLPNMDVVASGKVFNFHSAYDRVVLELADPPARQDFSGSVPAIEEEIAIVARRGHFKPVRRRIWIDNDLDSVVLEREF